MFALVAALYLFDLSNAPVYFGGDEAHFAAIGHSIAKTGRTLNGDWFPVFVNLADPLGEPPQPWGDTYYHPMLFYLDAAVMLVAPPTIAAARLPIAIIGGLLSPLLLYMVARRIIGQPLPALIAALVLALAPVHVILSRQALDYILPVPFVLGWLWCVDASLRNRDGKYGKWVGLILGAGCYSYIASWAVMPLLLAVTWAIWLRAGFGWRPIVVSAVAFVIPVIIAPLWIALHPQMLHDTMARYSGPSYAPPKTPFVPTFVSLINPILWFVRGGPSMTTATARSGVVLVPVAALLAGGAIALVRRRDWRAAVIVSGIVIGLIPAAIKGEIGMIQRAMYVLPFIALAAGFGFAWLWQFGSGRLIAMLLLAASAAQFGYFYFDFFTHYKRRSAFYYDPVAFRDVAAELLHSPDAPAYFFTTDLDDSSVKWRFYTTLEGRSDLLSRTTYVGQDDRPAAAPGSMLVTYDASARIKALTDAGWQIVSTIKDVDNRSAAVILRKR